MSNVQYPTDETLIYGKNAAAELLKSGREVDTVWLQDSMPPAQASYYMALARQAGAVVKRIPSGKLRAMCGTEAHQGVAVRGALITYLSLEQLLQHAAACEEPPLLLLCDGIEDPHNLGALIRTALLCGAHGAIIPKRGGAGISATVMKSSAGAAAHLPIARVSNLGEAVRRLKKENVFVYYTDKSAPLLHTHCLTGACALIIGSEGRGVSPLLKRLCDGGVGLAMHARAGGIGSFNASVSGAIVLYEVMRQRSSEQPF